VAAAIVFVGSTSSTALADEPPGDKKVEPPAWGPESGGLSLNLTIPRRLYVGDEFAAVVLCKGRATPGGRELLSMWDVRQSMRLQLRPIGNAGAAPIMLREYSVGMPDFRDPGVSARPLIGERLLAQVGFLSAPADHKLAPGVYECSIHAQAPDHAAGEQNGQYLRPASEKAKRCWTGEVVSNSVTVELVRPDPDKETVFVPRALHKTRNGLSYSEAEADKMTFDIPRGHLIGVRTVEVVFETDASGARKERVQSQNLGRNYLQPGVTGASLPVGSEVRLTIFLTNERVGHLWAPSAGSGYRVLVTRSVPVIGEDDKAPEAAPKTETSPETKTP
jgi:hypothetical protein